MTRERHESVVEEHKSYFLWGLVPTQEIDVRDHCPDGAAAIDEQTSFMDGLVGVLTLGLWEMRSSTHYCLPPRLGVQRGGGAYRR